MSTPPPAPLVDDDSLGFWEAAREGRLVQCRCTACSTWLPRPMKECPCGAETSFEAVSGRGTVYSHIAVRHPSVPAFAALVPYAIALVELEEGPRVPGIVLDAAPEDVRIGAAVDVVLTSFEGAAEPAITFRLS